MPYRLVRHSVSARLPPFASRLALPSPRTPGRPMRAATPAVSRRPTPTRSHSGREGRRASRPKPISIVAGRIPNSRGLTCDHLRRIRPPSGTQAMPSRDIESPPLGIRRAGFTSRRSPLGVRRQSVTRSLEAGGPGHYGALRSPMRVDLPRTVALRHGQHATGGGVARRVHARLGRSLPELRAQLPGQLLVIPLPSRQPARSRPTRRRRDRRGRGPGWRPRGSRRARGRHRCRGSPANAGRRPRWYRP